MSAGTTSNPFDRNLDAFLGPSARRTLVLVGHLPVMSGLWLSQYADREARESGPVALLRIEQDAVQLELFRVGGRGPAVPMRSSLADALRAIASGVSTWMVVPRASEPVPSADGFSNVVVLTGSDETAVVAAYGLLKGCVERSAEPAAAGRAEVTPSRRIMPPLSVAVLGADEEMTARVAERLGRTTRAFLEFAVPVRGDLRQVAPVESAFRGTFDAPNPNVEEILAAIAIAERDATRPAAAAPTPRGERFGARPERMPPRARALRDESPLPFVPPSPAPRVASARPLAEPPRAVAASDPTPAELAVARTTVRSAVFRKGALEPEAATSAPATAPAPASVAGGLPPEPATMHPARRIEIASDDGAGTGLVTHLVDHLVVHIDGFRPVPFRSPRQPDLELATDRDGRLRIVGRPAQLGAMLAARSWAREHLAILRLACGAIVSNADAALDVVVASHREAREIEGVDSVWVLSKVELAGRQGYLVEAG